MNFLGLYVVVVAWSAVVVRYARLGCCHWRRFGGVLTEATATRRSSRKKTLARERSSTSWRSMQRQRWEVGTWGWPSCFLRARTWTSGLPSTVRINSFCSFFFLFLFLGGVLFLPCIAHWYCGWLLLRLLCRFASRRFFQPDQHALRHHHRVLHTSGVQDHVGWTQVRCVFLCVSFLSFFFFLFSFVILFYFFYYFFCFYSKQNSIVDAADTSISGKTEHSSRSQHACRHPSTLTISWPGFKISWTTSQFSLRRSVCVAVFFF